MMYNKNNDVHKKNIKLIFIEVRAFSHELIIMNLNNCKGLVQINFKLVKVENFIGLVITQILSFRQKSPYYFI